MTSDTVQQWRAPAPDPQTPEEAADPSTRFYRTILRVRDRRADNGIWFEIPRLGENWMLCHKVGHVISWPTQHDIPKGVPLMGYVNINAALADPSKLEVRNIERAPDPDPNDGLA